jgi:hypothetical protein
MVKLIGHIQDKNGNPIEGAIVTLTLFEFGEEEGDEMQLKRTSYLISVLNLVNVPDGREYVNLAPYLPLNAKFAWLTGLTGYNAPVKLRENMQVIVGDGDQSIEWLHALIQSREDGTSVQGINGFVALDNLSFTWQITSSNPSNPIKILQLFLSGWIE